MKVCHTVICCFFLSLVAAEIPLFLGVEGGKVTVECPFGVNADKKYLCKDPCGPTDLMIVTSQVGTNRSRYRLRCVPDAPMALLVTISELKLSDSSQYRCGAISSSFGTIESAFQILVLDASTLTPTEAETGMLLYLVVILVVIVVILGLAVMILGKRWNIKNKNFKKKGSPLRSNAENVFYMNCPEVSNREDPIYQSLSAATMDQNQTYSSLTNTENV